METIKHPLDEVAKWNEQLIRDKQLRKHPLLKQYVDYRIETLNIIK